MMSKKSVTPESSVSSPQMKRKSVAKNESNYSSHSMSTVSTNIAERVLNVCFADLIRNLTKEKLVAEVGSLSAPTPLLTKMFDCLHGLLLVRRYPSSLTPEANVTSFVSRILETILIYLTKELKFEGGTLLIVPEDPQNLTSEQLMLKLTGKSDYLVVHRKGLHLERLLVIEVKTNTNDGFKQCLLGAKYAYQVNNNKHKIYAITTDATHWRLLTYDEEADGQSVVHCFPDQEIMIDGMDSEESRDIWQSRCEEGVGMVYALLKKSLFLLGALKH